MPYALRVLSREGAEDWLRDQDAPRAVTAFASRELALAARKALLDSPQVAPHVQGIDVVPYPKEGRPW